MFSERSHNEFNNNQKLGTAQRLTILYSGEMLTQLCFVLNYGFKYAC